MILKGIEAGDVVSSNVYKTKSYNKEGNIYYYSYENLNLETIASVIGSDVKTFSSKEKLLEFLKDNNMNGEYSVSVEMIADNFIANNNRSYNNLTDSVSVDIEENRKILEEIKNLEQGQTFKIHKYRELYRFVDMNIKFHEIIINALKNSFIIDSIMLATRRARTKGSAVPKNYDLLHSALGVKEPDAEESYRFIRNGSMEFYASGPFLNSQNRIPRINNNQKNYVIIGENIKKFDYDLLLNNFENLGQTTKNENSFKKWIGFEYRTINSFRIFNFIFDFTLSKIFSKKISIHEEEFFVKRNLSSDVKKAYTSKLKNIGCPLLFEIGVTERRYPDEESLFNFDLTSFLSAIDSEGIVFDENQWIGPPEETKRRLVNYFYGISDGPEYFNFKKEESINIYTARDRINLIFSSVFLEESNVDEFSKLFYESYIKGIEYIIEEYSGKKTNSDTLEEALIKMNSKNPEVLKNQKFYQSKVLKENFPLTSYALTLQDKKIPKKKRYFIPESQSFINEIFYSFDLDIFNFSNNVTIKNALK